MPSTNSTSGAELPDDDSDLDSSSMSDDDKATMRRLRADSRATRAHERHLAQLAHQHVKGEHLDAALQGYAEHVRAGNVPTKGQEDDHARAFFQQYAQDNPQHARPAPPPLSTHEMKRRTGARW